MPPHQEDETSIIKSTARIEPSSQRIRPTAIVPAEEDVGDFNSRESSPEPPQVQNSKIYVD